MDKPSIDAPTERVETLERENRLWWWGGGFALIAGLEVILPSSTGANPSAPGPHDPVVERSIGRPGRPRGVDQCPGGAASRPRAAR